MKYRQLTPEEQRVILHKGTEAPFAGAYTDHSEKGYYVCKQCEAPLFESSSKFHSGCGWPSFDSEIPGMVYRFTDADGRRTEIVCANCGGHLGHVFTGEGYTPKNTRHCVNSISMTFIDADTYSKNYEIAVFASGCYWGTEYWLEKAEGVIATTVGYAGGKVTAPSYQQVCSGDTGHAESVRVFFNPQKTHYEALVKCFFETHDPTQLNYQGPDRGTQYRSEIFTVNEEQLKIAEKMKKILIEKGYSVVTKIEPLSIFYPERDQHHHHYYAKNGKEPYCHLYEEKF